MTDNDRGSRFHIKSGSWLSADMFIDCKEVQVIMDGKEQKPYAPDNNSYGCDVYADEVVVKYTYETITTPATTVLVSYTVDVSGKIRVDVHYNGVQGLPEFPVFGMRFIMPTWQTNIYIRDCLGKHILIERQEPKKESMRLMT